MGYYRYGFNGKEKDVDGEWGEHTTNYDYGARIYNPAIGKWLSMDSKAADLPNLSPYQYAANNPILFLDPDGKAHIIYLVVKRGTDKETVHKIQQATQVLVERNNINLNVQVIYTDENGFSNSQLDKLDNTDELVFVGSKDFVQNVYDRNIGDGKEIGRGIQKGNAGYINTDGFETNLDTYGEENFIGHIARAILHEGVGHKVLGGGHSDKEEGLPVPRYKKAYDIEETNVMSSEKSTDFLANPVTTKGGLFLPDDVKILKTSIPDKVILDGPTQDGCTRYQNCSEDNFSERIKEK